MGISILIKKRNDLLFQKLVDSTGFHLVPGRVIAMFLSITDRPTHRFVEGFCPPPIQLRKIEAPVY